MDAVEKTPYAKSCNRTVRKFYDDFDLLPREIKEILWDLPYTPDFDDLKAAWQLAEQQKGREWLLRTLHCYEEERKEDARQKAEARKAARQMERANRFASKWRSRTVNVYGLRKVDHSQDKHGRLIQMVKDEDAMKMLSQRKEAKDVKPVVHYERVLLGKAKVVEPDPEQKIVKPEPPQHICKMLHNAGGKPA